MRYEFESANMKVYIVSMQFYIAEGSLEVLARHMLFLALTFEPADKLGLQGMVTDNPTLTLRLSV